MKQHTFELNHQSQWEELEQWINHLDKRKLIKGQKMNQFPSLYRQICQHLALARDRHYTPQLIERLNRLVLRGHQHFYQTPSRLWVKMINFMGADFPNSVRRESRLVMLSGFLFFGSLLGMFVSIQINPDLIYSLMTTEEVENFADMYNPTSEHFGSNRESDSDFVMFGFYIYNNIGIGFQTFASGILFGLGTLFFIIFNGLYIGCLASYLTHIGYIVPFYSFVVGHSALELIAIVFAGAAGLKLGLALIAPGRLTRLHALRNAATESISLIYGVILMLLLAAFVEAFWSSNTAIAPHSKYIVGGCLWLGVISYFIWVGRNRAI